jgi:hypothetical protein
MVYAISSVFLGLLHTKLLPFPGGHAIQASKFMFPLSLTVVGHKTTCQIGALDTGKTTIT